MPRQSRPGASLPRGENMEIIKNVLMRRPAVESATGISRTVIYRRIGVGLFPRSINLGGGIVGWPSSEVDAINEARIAGKTDDEIKMLVTQLHQARGVDQNKPNSPARLNPVRKNSMLKGGHDDT